MNYIDGKSTLLKTLTYVSDTADIVCLITRSTASGHQSPGLWRHPDDQSWRFTDIDHWVELAKLLEKANFHGIFIADVLGMYGTLIPRQPVWSYPSISCSESKLTH